MADVTKADFKAINPPERKRTYHFPNNETITFENVSAVCARPSGTHRLETTDGKKYIVRAGWLAVELDMDAWTF